jgi:hypothetical protein
MHMEANCECSAKAKGWATRISYHAESCTRLAVLVPCREHVEEHVLHGLAELQPGWQEGDDTA